VSLQSRRRSGFSGETLDLRQAVSQERIANGDPACWFFPVKIARGGRQRANKFGESLTMSKDIYWVCVFKVQPAQFADFKAVVRPLVEMTRMEAGSMAYEYCVSDDNTAIHIIEHYRDSDAVVHHVQKTFSQFAEQFTALATVSSFVVYGDPDDSARAILDGFGAVYHAKFDGFTK
jgi:quinol monooxygenase YgiN